MCFGLLLSFLIPGCGNDGNGSTIENTGGQGGESGNGGSGGSLPDDNSGGSGGEVGSEAGDEPSFEAGDEPDSEAGADVEEVDAPWECVFPNTKKYKGSGLEVHCGKHKCKLDKDCGKHHCDDDGDCVSNTIEELGWDYEAKITCDLQHLCALELPMPPDWEP